MQCKCVLILTFINFLTHLKGKCLQRVFKGEKMDAFALLYFAKIWGYMYAAYASLDNMDMDMDGKFHIHRKPDIILLTIALVGWTWSGQIASNGHNLDTRHKIDCGHVNHPVNK